MRRRLAAWRRVFGALSRSAPFSLSLIPSETRRAAFRLFEKRDAMQGIPRLTGRAHIFHMPLCTFVPFVGVPWRAVSYASLIAFLTAYMACDSTRDGGMPDQAQMPGLSGGGQVPKRREAT